MDRCPLCAAMHFLEGAGLCPRFGSANLPGPVRVTALASIALCQTAHTGGMTLTTRMLTPETWDDFAALVEANNGV